MIVFLVGGESRLMDALITKMEKDGHKTYLLTGKRDGRGKYRRVFERYNFPYDSESVREIFTNVNPDLVIFLGAYDTNYDWSDARRESVRYTADLTNLLSAYAFKQNGRFVYLSSEVVYGRSYSSDIHETEPASSKSFQAMAILQGENICKSSFLFHTCLLSSPTSSKFVYALNDSALFMDNSIIEFRFFNEHPVSPIQRMSR